MGLWLYRGWFFIALGFLLSASWAHAGKVRPSLRALMLHVPAQVEVVAWAPVLRRLPTRLSRLLTRLEKKNPMGAQVRAFLEQVKTQSQIDLLSTASLRRLGLAQGGAGVVTMLDIQGTEWVLLVGTLRSAGDFDKGLDRLVSHVATGTSLRRQVTSVAGGKIVTLFSTSPNAPSNEALAAYAVVGQKVLMVGKSKQVSAALPNAAQGPDSSAVLKRLLSLSPQRSMANHPAFLDGARRLRGGEFGAILVQNKRSLGSGVSLGAPILQRSSFSWVVAGLMVDDGGLRATLYAEAPLDRDIMRLRSVLGRVAGVPANLAKMLHKNALLAARISLNVRKLVQTSLADARQKAARGGPDPQEELARFRKIVGMDLEKEVVPIFTGHALIALLGVDPSIVSYARRRPAIVPSLVEAVMLIEVRSPSGALRLLSRLPDIAARRRLPPVKELKGVNGAPMYKIIPSSGAALYLTVIGRSLVIALNRKALAFTLSATRTRSQRLFAASVPKVLVQRRGLGLILSLRNLYRAINQLNLGFSTRMVLAGFLPFLQGMEISTFRFLPTRKGFKMDMTLELSP